ncbi:MAG: flagellar biosynthetic protein FliO [Defluviitaleaceae bacterium]|nr:flagellar biosynthetic protein FliO [Defluviitaleaceae bacterium]
MENLMLFLNGISESWSTLSADRLFSMFSVGAAGFSGTPNADRFGLILSMLRFFGATLFVAWLAWFATKKMASSRSGVRETCNLSVVESINVGGQAVVRLVKAGDKYLLVGVTKERITYLAEIDKEQIIEQKAPELTNLNTPFGKVLSRFIQPKPGDEDKKDE